MEDKEEASSASLHLLASGIGSYQSPGALSFSFPSGVHEFLPSQDLSWMCHSLLTLKALVQTLRTSSGPVLPDRAPTEPWLHLQLTVHWIQGHLTQGRQKEAGITNREIVQFHFPRPSLKNKSFLQTNPKNIQISANKSKF